MVQNRIYENILLSDYDVVVSLIEKGSRVLDLGCGNGSLLVRLIKERQVHARGVEIKQDAVIACIHKGLSVFQGDIDAGLADYGNATYDYVVLNQTLQAIHRPDFVIEEMLRVGKKAIISFPNFGYWRIRKNLMLRGCMPRTNKLPFDWYNTPNIHLLTIQDFIHFCKARKITILKKISLLKNNRRDKANTVSFLPNFFADEGLFVITSQDPS
ncbi:methionine biosynthesis protein MetW [bacterium]|nr:methionine biosynthesis protein MetW [bacterium]